MREQSDLWGRAEERGGEEGWEGRGVGEVRALPPNLLYFVGYVGRPFLCDHAFGAAVAHHGAAVAHPAKQRPGD